MRPLSICALLLSITFVNGARASSPPLVEPPVLSGTPVVRDSGIMMLNGRSFSLWGIMPFAGDQRCWRGQKSWDCGEQAALALKHFVEGRHIECHVMDQPVVGRLKAQCFRKSRKGKEAADVGQFLVRHGWALDDAESSGGQYAKDQNEAFAKKRGVWGSSFQTADDWREGIQRFIDKPQTSPAKE